ncbi:MAG: RluA family pseudouridine synthase [Burkholderiaceae bacterium]|nr:RluA family pseudouridine synthase [Burkholderiaceae bacterium]
MSISSSTTAANDDDTPDAPPTPTLTFHIDDRHAGDRLDKALAQLLPDVSRSRLQTWIDAAAVTVNGGPIKQRYTLSYGDVIEVDPRPAPDAAAYQPQAMPLDVVFEDAALLVLNKPPGLVVHPAPGHWSGTLLNGLLAYQPALVELPRAGIVHRLDADTSGLMVVAKTLAAHTDLVRQLQARTVTREYWALVLGTPPLRGVIDAAIARDPRNPMRFKVSTAESAKDARTHYARIAVRTDAGADIAWLSCRLETGRTHQIRVHLEHIGHPLIGDPVYRRRLPARSDAPGWKAFERQALHASRLSLKHPATARRLTWFQAPAPDLADLMQGFGFGPLDIASNIWNSASD